MEHCRGCAAVRDGVQLVPEVQEVQEVREVPLRVRGRHEVTGKPWAHSSHWAAGQVWLGSVATG